MAENNIAAPEQQESLSEVLQVRREKLADLKQSGNDPFTKTKFEVSDNSVNIKNNFEQF